MQPGQVVAQKVTNTGRSRKARNWILRPSMMEKVASGACFNPAGLVQSHSAKAAVAATKRAARACLTRWGRCRDECRNAGCRGSGFP